MLLPSPLTIADSFLVLRFGGGADDNSNEHLPRGRNTPEHGATRETLRPPPSQPARKRTRKRQRQRQRQYTFPPRSPARKRQRQRQNTFPQRKGARTSQRQQIFKLKVGPNANPRAAL